MIKIVVCFLLAIVLVFFVGCATEAPQYFQLQEENAALHAQVAALEGRLEQHFERQRERFGDPVFINCGLTLIEIVEHTPGELMLVIHACRIAFLTGFEAQDFALEDPRLEFGRYRIDFVSVSDVYGPSSGINPLFERLYPWNEAGSVLSFVPPHLEAANIRFHLQGLASNTYGLVFSSDIPMSIDESRVDWDELPRTLDELPYFPNVGDERSNFRFEIPIVVGE